MKQHRKKHSYFLFVSFGVFMSVSGILFFILPKKIFSDYEKRKLARIPPFSWDNVFHGHYFDSLDHYVADNFPMRDNFVEASFDIANHRGVKDDEVSFVKTIAVDKQVPVGVDTTLTPADSSNADSVVAALPAGDADESDGLLIYNNHAMEVFGGTTTMAKAYAQVINKYQQLLGGKTTIYSVLVPSSIEFNAPDEYKKDSRPEKDNISIAYGALDPGVKTVDAFSSIAAHRNEYIFFATDHHWTGLGAYYAYTAFCNSAGLTAITIPEMETKMIKRYLGSFYSISHISQLKDHPDSVIYYKVPGVHNAYRVSGKRDIPASVYAEFASGYNSYGVFLGGDIPLMRIDNPEIHNGRKAVLVKNSYGNPFATYLVANFEQVYVVDYRYYSGSLPDLVTDNGITDLIFLNGIFSANTSWHLKMMAKIMRASSPAAPKKQENDSAKKSDADTVRTSHNDSLKTKKSKPIP